MVFGFRRFGGTGEVLTQLTRRDARPAVFVVECRTGKEKEHQCIIEHFWIPAMTWWWWHFFIAYRPQSELATFGKKGPGPTQIIGRSRRSFGGYSADTELSHRSLAASFEKLEVHGCNMKKKGGGQKKSSYTRLISQAFVTSG